MKLLLFCLVALTSAQLCSAASEVTRRCVFSIEIVADGGGLHRIGDTSVGDKVVIYEYEDGWIIGERHEAWHGIAEPQRGPDDDRFGSGPQFTDDIRLVFKKAKLGSFNFDKALALARQKESQAKGPILVLVGPQTVKVFADFEGTHFSFTCAGLGATLDHLAQFSPEFQKLKSLLDSIAFEYGRHRIFL